MLNINAPTNSLMKYFIKIISLLKKFESLSVNNNIKLDKNYPIPISKTVISFNVDDLFINIPIDSTKHFWKTGEWFKHFKCWITELLNLIIMCDSENFSIPKQKKLYG